jgi:ATP-dependent helicase Lhr and Lhr-like helicase
MPSRTGPPTAAGRWSGVPTRETDATRRAQARTESFLERHGVLTRGALDTERATGGFAGIYPVLRAMEESGRARRGYVIEGLGAAQFAVPGAIDRLRAESRPEDTGGGVRALVLAATDPAQPWGAALDFPPTVGQDGGTSAHRPGRKAGALVVLADGVPAIYVERGGKSLLSFTTDHDVLTAAASALATAVREGWLGSIAVEKADGSGALDGVLAEVLTEAGFRHSPKGLRLRA